MARPKKVVEEAPEAPEAPITILLKGKTSSLEPGSKETVYGIPFTVQEDGTMFAEMQDEMKEVARAGVAAGLYRIVI